MQRVYISVLNEQSDILGPKLGFTQERVINGLFHVVVFLATEGRDGNSLGGWCLIFSKQGNVAVTKLFEQIYV